MYQIAQILIMFQFGISMPGADTEGNSEKGKEASHLITMWCALLWAPDHI